MSSGVSVAALCRFIRLAGVDQLPPGKQSAADLGELTSSIGDDSGGGCLPAKATLPIRRTICCGAFAEQKPGQGSGMRPI